MEKNFFKQVKNTLGRGEIAHYEQFLLFPHCIRYVRQTCKNQGLFENKNQGLFVKGL